MTRFDLTDDDVLLDLMSETIDAVDPVPAAAIAAAKAVAQMSHIDAELATLVADSLLDADVVLFRHDLALERLGEPSDRLVTFATPRLSVDIDLQSDGATMIGAITPAMLVDVDLETNRGTMRTRSDDLGRFHLDAGTGRCRLRIHAYEATVVTPWITR